MNDIPQGVQDAAAKIRKQCRTQMGLTGPDARVALIVLGRMPRGPFPKKRLAGRSGPVGECITETTKLGKDGVLCYFRATEVLRWLDSVIPGAEGREGEGK